MAAKRLTLMSGEVMYEKVCSVCAVIKPITDYHISDSRRNTFCYKCQSAKSTASRNARYTPEERSARQKIYNSRRNQAANRASKLKSRYGMTPEECQQLLASQNYKCAICFGVLDPSYSFTESTMHIDHCHDSNRVRGLLCRMCNFAIGAVKDDPAILQSAIAYLASGGVELAKSNNWVARTPPSASSKYRKRALNDKTAISSHQDSSQH